MMLEIMEIMDELKGTTGLKHYLLKLRIERKLKKNFFDIFNIYYTDLNYSLIREVLCMHESDRFDKEKYNKFVSIHKYRFPLITNVKFNNSLFMEIQFYEYSLRIYPCSLESATYYGRWHIEISYVDKDTNREISYSMHPLISYMNTDSKLRATILMAIYNYCVLYVYGTDLVGSYKKLIKTDMPHRVLSKHLKELMERR